MQPEHSHKNAGRSYLPLISPVYGSTYTEARRGLDKFTCQARSGSEKTLIPVTDTLSGNVSSTSSNNRSTGSGTVSTFLHNRVHA